MSKQVQSHVLSQFTLLRQMGSGAYGHVWQVQQKKSKERFALKKVFDAFRNSVDAQRTYRQVQILRQLNHDNIIKLFRVIKSKNKRDLYLIFQFMQADLHSTVGSNVLEKMHQIYVFYQMLRALKYLHSAELIHRDLKPSNVLLNSQCQVKICDFGLIRTLNSQNDQEAILSEQVATKWYRAPQLLLGSRSYKKPIDVWSFGCIVAQILTGKPLFAGDSTLNQLQRIMQFTGQISKQDIESLDSPVAEQLITQIKVKKRSFRDYFSSVDPDFWVLLKGVLQFNPNKRMTMDQVLQLDVFDQFRDQIKNLKISSRPIRPSIDDNLRFGLKVYRDKIYEDIDKKQKSDSIRQGKRLGQVQNAVSNSKKNQIIYKKRTISQEKNMGKSFQKVKNRQFSVTSQSKNKRKYYNVQKQRKSQSLNKSIYKSSQILQKQNLSPYKSYLSPKSKSGNNNSQSANLIQKYYKKQLLPTNTSNSIKIKKIDGSSQAFIRKKSPHKQLISIKPKNQTPKKILKKVSSVNGPRFFSKKNILKSIGFSNQDH